MNQTMRTILIIGLTAAICGGGTYLMFGGTTYSQIMVSGSTTVQPLMDAWQIEYEKDHSVALYVAGGGSSVGRTNTLEGKSDIGMVSASKPTPGLTEYLIAYDAVVAVVSANVNVSDLTRDELKDIFTLRGTDEKKWGEYTGGDDAAITTVIREYGSGTRDSFNSGVGIMETSSGTDTYKGGNNQQEMNSAGGTLSFINGHNNAIGYVNMNALNEIGPGKMYPNIKAIMVEGAEATSENVQAKFDPSVPGTPYQLSRELFVVTKTNGLTGDVKSFIQWMYSDAAQQVAEDNGFVKLTETIRNEKYMDVR